MAFAQSITKVSKQAKMARAGGMVASSMARKADDPLIKQRDMLKKKLKELNEKIKAKYAAKAKAAVLKM